MKAQKHKKTYARPVLKTVEIDSTLTLVMMSAPPGDPPAGKESPDAAPQHDENSHFE